MPPAVSRVSQAQCSPTLAEAPLNATVGLAASDVD